MNNPEKSRFIIHKTPSIIEKIDSHIDQELHHSLEEQHLYHPPTNYNYWARMLVLLIILIFFAVIVLLIPYGTDNPVQTNVNSVISTLNKK